MKTSIFFASIFAFSLHSCNESSTSEPIEVIDNHTSEIALDWQGTYSGNLPCADCDNIETELTLTDDLDYTLISQYIGKDPLLADTLTGKFTWQGSQIKLEGIPENSRSAWFKVEENQVRHLDMDGNQIEGDLASRYVMKKNGNWNVEDKRWQLVELMGQPIKGSPETHYIIFHSKEARLEAKANCNNLSNSYKIQNELQLTIEPGISTKMACPEKTEQVLTEVLLTADNLSTDGKSLSLNKARMAPLARFELVEENN